MKTINLLSGLVLVTGITIVSCTKSQVAPSASSVNFKIQATSKVQLISKALLASVYHRFDQQQLSMGYSSDGSFKNRVRSRERK